MRRRILIIAALTGLFFLNCEKTKEENKNVLVSVGDGVLTLERLQAEIPVSIKDNITQENINNYIQQWIESELIYQDALSLGMDTDPELEYAIEKAKKNFLVSRYLSKFLVEENMVLETEALEYYEENKDSYTLAEDKVKALHILMEKYQDARNVRKRLINGEDFEAVAKEISLDYLEKKRIVLDYFSRDEVIPEIGAVAFNLRVDGISNPIKSDFGYHILKIVDKRRKGSEIEFDEVKNEIIARIQLMKKNEKYRDLIIDLRNRINIRKEDELLQHLFIDSLYVKENKTIEEIE